MTNAPLAVVFDVGNVLIDWDARRVYREVFDTDAAIDQFFEEVDFFAWNLEQDRGRGWAEAVDAAAAKHPHRRELLAKYDRDWAMSVPGPIPGTVAILKELRDAGVPLFAITNFAADKWEETRARFDFLADSFRDVVVSGQERIVKPDPAIYLTLLERNDLAPNRCVFIDDSPANIRGAERVGMDAVRFTGPEALRHELIARGLPLAAEGASLESPPAVANAPSGAAEAPTPGAPSARYAGYNFAYLDENTKRMIRRAILKAVAVPGYQTPFASREMPMPYGWGTGGVQVTAACLTPDDRLKVIDQGADDTTNAVSIRQFFEKTAGVETTTRTEDASIIQTRHRIPETDLTAGQILVYQVPIPEPLRFLEPRETETRKMHALEEYGLMHVKLYEDIARHGRIATTYAYPVKVGERYVMDPSPIPKFDNPKLSNNPALQLFGAGREQRIYALPPHTPVKSLDFDDYPFDPGHWPQCCALCGAEDSYLDEIITDDAGGRMFVCSDTDFCNRRRAAQENWRSTERMVDGGETA